MGARWMVTAGRTLALLGLLGMVGCDAAAAAERSANAGCLQIIPTDDESQPEPLLCPLEHTSVEAHIAGFLARVEVEQVFTNPTDRKIEAIYVFPLPDSAAVDQMTLTVGGRTVVGEVREREEAREVYEQAKAAGHVAALLDQERPNIFTQAVANIEPGDEVRIRISYVETVPFEAGEFEWSFPMVVGPRYIPGGGSAPAPEQKGSDTPEVPDGSKITPPVTPEGTRAGHDISLTVDLVGGAALQEVASLLHAVETTLGSEGESATIALVNQQTIPNRDFVLRYRLGDEQISDAFLVHEDERGKFFTLALLPPAQVEPAEIVPRELVFVLDTSGSMSGFPMEKAKALMDQLIATMQPSDTFNVITFAGRTQILWESPQPASEANITAAREFVSGQQGSGGTEMMKAIDAALRRDDDEAQAEAIRVVCFLTDGYVGNDMAIVDAVKEHAAGTRVFSFGVGNSVNRFLLDRMAQAGRGECTVVTLAEQADEAVADFHERILAPVLTDVTIDWGTLPVSDVYPARIPDLFSAQPIMVHGRLTGPAEGTITLRGNRGDGPYEEAIALTWPESPPDQDALASIWARQKVEHLMMQDYAAAQQGTFPEALKTQVIDLGVDFQIMTQFTSFVAVERLTVTSDGAPVQIDVPVEMPAGVSYDGVFAGQPVRLARSARVRAPSSASTSWGGRAYFAARRAGQGAAPAAAEKATYDYAGGKEQAAELTPEQQIELKLAEPLRELAAQVTADGTDGDLDVEKLKVRDWRINVMITLFDRDDATLAALEELGFELAGAATTTRLVIGSIDVRKLHDLAQLEDVRSVRPVEQG